MSEIEPLPPDQLRKERAKLVDELQEVCAWGSVRVNDATVLRLVGLCQRSLYHLSLPEKAAMQYIIGGMEMATDILREREAEIGRPDA